MPFEGGSFVLDMVGVVSTAGGAVGSVLNPEGKAVVITKVVVAVETQPDSAANLNVGIGAAATTDASDLVSALTVDAATGKCYNGLNPAAKAEHIVWGATQYLNVTGSADTTGLVGKVLVHYMRHV
ncbi:MAG TPA: hypothetical protein VMX14_03780 [Anaerolineae bacterium]|nr:hypothetical protein [Anaerolineae bacterium]HUW11283.1 hypothetical protein [Anaerolineae bacterium]